MSPLPWLPFCEPEEFDRAAGVFLLHRNAGARAPSMHPDLRLRAAQSYARINIRFAGYN